MGSYRDRLDRSGHFRERRDECGRFQQGQSQNCGESEIAKEALAGSAADPGGARTDCDWNRAGTSIMTQNFLNFLKPRNLIAGF